MNTVREWPEPELTREALAYLHTYDNNMRVAWRALVRDGLFDRSYTTFRRRIHLARKDWGAWFAATDRHPH